MNLPWVPLFTIERSGEPEVTLYGMLAITDGSDNSLFIGANQNAKLWTRSLLKPWQLLNHLYILKKHYPQLQPEHYALMLSSHSGESIHLKALDEILALGGINESLLQNTPLYPLSPGLKIALKDKGEKPQARWGNCSGKHAGFLLALKALGQDPTLYLNKDAAHFVRMKKLLAFLLNEDWRAIPETTDGCRMPNYAFNALNIAKLYWQLWHPVRDLGLPSESLEMAEILPYFGYLSQIMSGYPEYVGGAERLDTELMQGKYTVDKVRLVAKQGADGLLALGIAPCHKYPRGLGILIKSSSGDDPRYFTILVKELLAQLGLLKTVQDNQLLHINRQCHFNIEDCLTVAKLGVVCGKKEIEVNANSDNNG